jgi:hypothetical protein
VDSFDAVDLIFTAEDAEDAEKGSVPPAALIELIGPA